LISKLLKIAQISVKRAKNDIMQPFHAKVEKVNRLFSQPKPRSAFPKIGIGKQRLKNKVNNAL